MQKVFNVISGTFALVPGLIVMATSIGIPPGSSQVFYSATIESLGAFTLLIIIFNKGYYKALPLKIINTLAIGAIVIFLISFFSYLFLYDLYIVTVANTRPVFFPLWPKGELLNGLESLKSPEGLIKEWGRDDVIHVINTSSHRQMVLSNLLFLFLYQFIFTSLTFAFGLLSVRTLKTSET